MPREVIGQCGDGTGFHLTLGLEFLRGVFEEPHDCELDIVYTDYEFGDGRMGAYASIGIVYEGRVGGVEQFAARCQDAVSAFNEAVDWSKITADALAERFKYQLGASGKLKVLDEERDNEEEDE